MRARHVLFLLGASLLCGCAVGPKYRRPKVNAPPDFRQLQAPSPQSIADQKWWEIFHDETLQQLIREAIQNNYDLRIAAVRVEEARASARIDAAALYPQVNAGGDVDRVKNPPFVANTTASLSPQLSWELDFWGRLRKQRESGWYQFVSQEEARRDALVSLIANVAEGYFTLRELDLELQITQDTVKTRKQTLDLFNKLRAAGVNSGLDVASAQADLYSAEASIPDFERQIVQQENSIRLLLGEPPGQVPRGALLTEQYLPPEIPAGIPSALLERRPDIREAEASLQSFNALIGVARANFFPRISLTGLFGVASDELSGLSSGLASTYSAGASLTAPIFQGGALRANYELAKQQYEESRQNYEKTAQTAFSDVANSLVQYQKLGELRAIQEQQVDALQRALHLSSLRYAGGLSSYLDVLDAQRNLFNAQIALAQTRGGQLLALAQLYRALGGGWQQ